MLSLNIDPLQYVWNLPQFNGDYRDLQNFIDLVDKIQPIIAKYDHLSQTIIWDNIIAKLKGNAREVIEIDAHCTDWLQIRKILINNFGVRGSIEELFDELICTKFKTNSAVFYSEIITALHRLNLKTKQTTDRLSTGGDIEKNKKSALTVFKNRLPEPMRSLLYCRNPTSLEEANSILHECGYAYYCPAKSYSNPFPFQHRQNEQKTTFGSFNTCAFGGPTNSQNSSLFGSKQTVPEPQIKNVISSDSLKGADFGIFGNKPSSNNENISFLFPQGQNVQQTNGGPFTASSITKPTNSQNGAHFGLFGYKPTNNEFHKVVQTQLKLPSPPNPPAANANPCSIACPTDRLPYIMVNGEKRPLKLIVDVEATHTILNPGVCSPGDIETLPAPINVKVLQKNVEIKHKALIPLFEELGSPVLKMECYIYPFHDRFDGLLGNNVLQTLKSKIDLEHNMLVVGNRVVELHFQDKQPENTGE